MQASFLSPVAVKAAATCSAEPSPRFFIITAVAVNVVLKSAEHKRQPGNIKTV